MMNYIKSELYRVSHTNVMYCFAGILAAASILLHAGLYYYGNQYATTSFSYSCLVANPMVFSIIGTVIAYLLYEENRKNGNLKNTVASGIPRTKIFIGECAVSLITATLTMVFIMTVWTIGAALFLEKTGPVELYDLLSEVPAVYFIAAAGVVSGICFLELVEKSITGILVWFSVWMIIPKILMYLGMRFEAIYEIALWLPSNFFAMINGQYVNTQQCMTAWDTTGGMARCVLSGIIGIAVFTLSGAALLRKKDL